MSRVQEAVASFAAACQVIEEANPLVDDAVEVVLTQWGLDTDDLAKWVMDETVTQVKRQAEIARELIRGDTDKNGASQATLLLLSATIARAVFIGYQMALLDQERKS